MGAQSSAERSIEIKNPLGPNLEHADQSEGGVSVPKTDNPNQSFLNGRQQKFETEDLDTFKQSVREGYSAWMKELEEENQGLVLESKEKYIQQADQLQRRFKYVKDNPQCVLPLREVQQCYEANPREPLNCADNVQYFKDCIREAQTAFKYTDPASGGNS